MAKEKNKEAYKINNPDLPNDPVARFNYQCFLSKVNSALYLNNADDTTRESVSNGLGQAYAATLRNYSENNQSRFDEAWTTLQDSIDSYIRTGDLASESRSTLLRNAATGFLGMNSSLKKDTLKETISKSLAPKGLTVHNSQKSQHSIGLGDGIVLTRNAENQPTTQKPKKVKCPS